MYIEAIGSQFSLVLDVREINKRRTFNSSKAVDEGIPSVYLLLLLVNE